VYHASSLEGGLRRVTFVKISIDGKFVHLPLPIAIGTLLKEGSLILSIA
jgi:hypothetical protein